MDALQSKRRLVVGALFLLSIILYVDRVCISTAKQDVSRDLALSNEQMGWVFGVFTLGYALAQVPSGFLIDRFGPRLILALIVAVWSIFTGLTGLVGGFVALIVIRFIFGIGEAGAFPGAARVFYSWLPTGQRGLANGLIFSGSRLGGALAYLVLPAMIIALGWRSTFFTLGGLGVVWAVLWYVWFRDQPPTEQTQGNQIQEQAKPIDYAAIYRGRSIWLTMVQYFASNFTFFICLSWMLPYLQDQFSLSAIEAGQYAMVPLIFAAASQWTSGWAVDRLYASAKWIGWSRRLPAALGFTLAAIGLALVTQVDSPFLVVTCFTLAVFGADMTISPSLTQCVDLGGKGAGTISGSMNMIGNIGAFLSSISFPYLYGWTGTATTYFVLAALLNILGVFCWLAIKPVAAEEVTLKPIASGG